MERRPGSIIVYIIKKLEWDTFAYACLLEHLWPPRLGRALKAHQLVDALVDLRTVSGDTGDAAAAVAYQLDAGLDPVSVRGELTPSPAVGQYGKRRGWRSERAAASCSVSGRGRKLVAVDKR